MMHKPDDTTTYDLGDLLALPVEAAPEFRNWKPSDRRACTESRPSGGSPGSTVTSAERRFLETVMEHPGQPCSA